MNKNECPAGPRGAKSTTKRTVIQMVFFVNKLSPEVEA